MRQPRFMNFHYVADQLRIEMPIFSDVLRNSLLQQEPYSPRAEQQTPCSDRENPHISEARRKIVAYGANGAPALNITA